MTKKNWYVTAPGYKPFPMILLDEAGYLYRGGSIRVLTIGIK
jgi:hypothetical protein